jgi:EpsI family protein
MIARPAFFGPAVVIAIIGAVIGGFWLTFSNLVGFSENAEGSAHTTFVLAAFLVLLWGARTNISTLPIRPFMPGILGLLVAGLIWLAGELVFARVLTHIGIVVMIPMTILTILGYQWLAALSFPLAFLLLAVPIGGSIVPTLVDWTATFAVAGLQVSGIPVHREGAYLIVPSGAWSVADSCSGITYLRTVTMLSILYAWSMYRFFPKRLAFIVGGILVGITGNWLRAYLTILIAHLSDNRFLRDDHSTFGWVLFALLLFTYCAIGYRYRDGDGVGVGVGVGIGVGVGEQGGTDTDVKQPVPAESKTQSRSLHLAGVVLATLMAIAVWPILQRTLQGSAAVAPVEISDIAPARGWTSVASPAVSWTPTLTNPSRQRVQSFERDGRRVDVIVGVFQNQTWTSKLVTVVNGFALQDNPLWSLAVRGSTKIEFAGQPLDVETGVVLGGGVRILAWRWYWIHGTSTANDAQAKIAQLLARLRSLADTSAWVSVYADATASTAEGAALLDQFMREMGPSVQQALVATAR